MSVYPSDFGIEHMAKEALTGPTGIWKKTTKKADSDEDSSSSSDEDDEHNHALSDDSDSNSDADDVSISEDEQSPSDVESDDNVSVEDFANENHRHNNKRTSKKKENGVDEVALRAYELQKLRYYFAVATCDSVATANGIYDQLDGMEFEHSSMTFDLRFVPDDVSFEERKVRDVCGRISTAYKPPEFIVNALQQTSVECTWDTGEKNREKLTHISQWRQLQESDFSQYIASDSSGDEDSEDEDAKKKVAMLRKSLLGDCADSDSDAEEDVRPCGVAVPKKVRSSKKTTDDPFNDPFFMDANDDDGENDEEDYDPFGEEPTKSITSKTSNQGKASKKDHKRKNAEEEGDMVYDYMSTVKDPQEGSKKKAKKERKAAQDAIDQDKAAHISGLLSEEGVTMDKGGRKSKKKRSKKEREQHKKEEKEGEEGFTMDLQDARFASVLGGDDAKYAIDPTSSEFKESKGIRDIFDEQQRRRKKSQKDKKSSVDNTSPPSNASSGPSTVVSGKGAADSLMNKVKNKFKNIPKH